MHAPAATDWPVRKNTGYTLENLFTGHFKQLKFRQGFTQDPRYKTVIMFNNRNLIGSLIALTSAMSFALNVVLAGKSYEYGANIHSLNLARATLFLGCLLMVVKLNHSQAVVTGRAHLLCGVVGVLLCIEMYVMLGAIQTIPVAVAVLVFYTYPILIALFGWITGTDRFSGKLLGLLVIAFGGLVIVLVDSPVQLAPEGLAYSVAAALVMAAMLITSEKALKQYNNYQVLLHSLMVVTAIILVMSMTIVDLALPTIAPGWLFFAGSTVFYVMGTFCLFTAVSMIGPLRTAIIDTTAPIWAVVFGLILLNQNLTGQQIAGAAMVVTAVGFQQYLKSRANA